jgi:hypothetical protein
MRRTRMRSLIAIALLILMMASPLPAGSTGLAEGQSETDRQGVPVATDQLPDRVMEGVQAEVGDAEILAVVQTNTDGVETYAVTWTLDGVTIETVFSAAGAVVSRSAILPGEGVDPEDDEDDPESEEEQFEREITIDLVPEPAKSAILREAGDHEIAEVEIVIVDGWLLYDADWISEGYEVGITVAPDGEIVGREREELDKDDDSEDD